jgi:hypothetical protein
LQQVYRLWPVARDQWSAVGGQRAEIRESGRLAELKFGKAETPVPKGQGPGAPNLLVMQSYQATVGGRNSAKRLSYQGFSSARFGLVWPLE